MTNALFLREFFRSPARTGAIAPSSRRLGEAVVAPIPERGDPVVVELGPGTGAFTTVIQEKLAGRGRHLAIELNPTLAAHIAARHPGVEVLNDNAADLPRLLAERGVQRADVVISGLPWASFPVSAQRSILAAVHATLSPTGAFTTFAYTMAAWTPAARRFRGMLRESFEEVVLGRTITANLPPAFVYHARRPRGAA
ncbi:class I SAM-dependent methyltransferase [Catenuloplanes atrovinosus]|uniref:Phospholipid N-methyltransferase n=1 Tax=Catenuloplanes atrovinosus TaxID=137266 RepID=A0AAE3YSF7_9ACTN|nr:methyltransferase domain-containing protein [Catenuloplanes atrovinosus]MDR7278795.1 phospholipid N-methyltransferase [Catenuloplanes atrovinosus]